MKKGIVVLSIFSLILPLILFVRIVYANSSGESLRFEVTNIKNTNGQVGVNLFRNDDEMFDKPYRAAYAVIEKGEAVVIFEGLPHGDYGAVAYHDENKNKVLDHNFLGFPAEPMGFTGDFEFWLFSGPPGFDDLKFQYEQKNRTIGISLE